MFLYHKETGHLDHRPTNTISLDSGSHFFTFFFCIVNITIISIVVLGSVPNFLAILERETPNRRRRRAAQAEVIDELDDLISDLDD